jgi:hypothetical protein
MFSAYILRVIVHRTFSLFGQKKSRSKNFAGEEAQKEIANVSLLI